MIISLRLTGDKELDRKIRKKRGETIRRRCGCLSLSVTPFRKRQQDMKCGELPQKTSSFFLVIELNFEKVEYISATQDRPFHPA